MTVMTKPQQSFRLEPVHPKPEEAHTMPYAPAVHIVGACDLMFLSGATPSPLYHKHPHVDAEHVHPHSIEEQTDRAMVAIKSILDHAGASWRDVVKVTKYLTDFREADAMHKTMQIFRRLAAGSTTVCINRCRRRRAHRARHDRRAAEEGDVTLPPHLARIVEAEYPRFSDAEMARRRAAIEALLAEADCDHLVFCGANRFGSSVQWLTQWPVTAEAVGVLTPGERDALFVQYVNHAPQARILADKAEVAWGGKSSIAAAIEVLAKRGARENRVGDARTAHAPINTRRFRRSSASSKASTATMSACGR